MADVTIRTATMDDYEAICRLLEQADRLHAELLPGVFQPFDGPPRTRERVAELVEGADADYIVAEAGGHVVGLVNLSEARSPPYPMFRPRRFAKVENLVVDAAHRRRGVATALLQAAKAWARERGVATVQLSVWAANEAAVAFYRESGFRRVVETMELDLGEH